MYENLTEDELKRLKEARSAAELNAVLEAVTAARGGRYPPDWDTRVIRSGVLADTLSRFPA